MSGSFFGQEFGLPEDPILRERAAFLANNAGDVDARLESLALDNDDLERELEEDLDNMNEQTFDADVSEIAGREFDFFKNTIEGQSKIPFPQTTREQAGARKASFNPTPQVFEKLGVNVQQSLGIPVVSVSAAGPVAPLTSNAPFDQANQAQANERRRGMTLAELEAHMLQQRNRTMSTPAIHHKQPQQKPLSLRERRADPETIASRRAERERKAAELSRYDNMMTRHDKDYIIRIQISQLLTDDPAADDFYCHMFQLSRGICITPGGDPPQSIMPQQSSVQAQAQTPDTSEAQNTLGQSVSPVYQQDSTRGSGPQTPQPVQSGRDSASILEGISTASSAGSVKGGSNNHRPYQANRSHRSNTQSSMARMQQQVQRIVNEARRRPKASHVAPEGALGKISVNSARNPKQVIQVQRGHAGSVSTDMRTQSPAGHHDLGGIFPGLGETHNPAVERRKTLCSIETVYNAVLRLEQLIREQARLPPNPEHPSVQNWLSSYNSAKELAWNEIEASQPISNTYPHPLVRFLSFAKGKRIIPRLIHHLSIDQVLAFITTVIANFESLDVCRFGSFSYTAGSPQHTKQREETDLFLQVVIPPALTFLADTSLQIVNGLFALFMERNNVAWVARTRPALAFLTMFLGRTEVLKQASVHGFAPGPLDKQEVYQANELYNHLFNSLRGSFATVFPPSTQTLGVQQPNPMEDIHAWQFLAALATPASVEQQHVLVAEIREKVLERVQLANNGHLPVDVASAIKANVNLFLNALGLDASQVAM